jgi:hypothetical protein
MKYWRGIFVLLVLATGMVACKKTNNNSPYPQITLTGFTPDSLKAGSFKDTAFIYFNFFDGDADLGVSSGPTNDSRIVVTDSRNGDSLTFDFPTIDIRSVDPGKGLEGYAVLKIQAAFLDLRPDSLHQLWGDTLQFTFHVVDNSGKESNKVTTPSLFLRP